jgi:hypothetical protein
MLLFWARRRFFANPLETNGFQRILKPGSAPEQGEKEG